MTQWKKVKYIKTSDAGPVEQHTYKYELILPTPLADWDVFDYWEKQRVISMEENLQKGDILFDIGAEHGWMSVIFGKIVSPESMVLVEPTPEFWPNIKETWEKNFSDILPLATYSGFFSDKTTDRKTARLVEPTQAWPEESKGNLIDKNSYKYIHEHANQVPQITLDEFVKTTGVMPTALTIDVEGAELLVLQGSEKTLKTHPIKVWLSIHPDLALRDYQTKRETIVEFMLNLGYKGKLLATDHEEHWFFEK